MQYPIRWRFAPCVLGLLCAGLAGCHAFSARVTWEPPLLAVPLVEAGPSEWPQVAATLPDAEWAYAEAMALESSGDAACVDRYYQAAVLAWPEASRSGDAEWDRPSELYRSALTRLISAGQHFQRFDPRSGLTVQTDAGPQHIPTRYHGFAWKPEEFNRLEPVGSYTAKRLNHVYGSCGLGVATVVSGCRTADQRFRRKRRHFSATVVLRPEEATTDGCPAPSAIVLDLYNPVSYETIRVGESAIPLRRDITAPFAYALRNSRQTYIEQFLEPGVASDDDGLFMIEPYQPGKIPLVFVHGLLSEPRTWVNIANELLAHPDLYNRYQLWGFEYPTGAPFLESAATLRQQLLEARAYVDPAGIDPALAQMVLVGHSMGGLVAKLQVAHSGDHLWRSVSRVPLSQIVASPERRRELDEYFFFEPSPLVSRVVFMATPHHGSPWAERCPGKIATALVEEPPDRQQRHQQLVDSNPGAFSEEFTERIPTSIDLLKPSSPLLNAMEQLPLADCLPFHSVIGYGYLLCGAGDSDAVVPVASARKTGAASEMFVPVMHTSVHQDQRSIDELIRILREHLRTVRSAGESCYVGVSQAT